MLLIWIIIIIIFKNLKHDIVFRRMRYKFRRFIRFPRLLPSNEHTTGINKIEKSGLEINENIPGCLDIRHPTHAIIHVTHNPTNNRLQTNLHPKPPWTQTKMSCNVLKVIQKLFHIIYNIIAINTASTTYSEYLTSLELSSILWFLVVYF